MLTEIELEDELPVHPDGNVHVYDDAPVTEAILYVCEDPWQTLVFPIIGPGFCRGGLVETFRLLVPPVPQPFAASTSILPPFDPATTVKDVVDEFPDHPDGIYHI
jgi:hypothetical protein